MAREMLSTTRPTPLRLAGFVATALGGLIVGLGATRDWATVGFPGDARGALDVAVKGIDVWEGKVALFAGLGILVVVVAMRLVASASARRAAAGLIVVLGLVAGALAAWDAAGPEARLGGAESFDRAARIISQRVGLPFATILRQLQTQFGRQLRLDLGVGVWLTILGAAVAVAGGVLGLVWAGRTAPAVEPLEIPELAEGEEPG